MATNGGAVIVLLLVIVLLAVTVHRGDAVLCHLCDSLEGNCIGASCEGSACIKRVAFVDGMLRVSKMCQLSGAEVVIEQCSPVPLWQGRFGTECICQSDWCNAAASITSAHTAITILIVVFLAFVV